MRAPVVSCLVPLVAVAAARALVALAGVGLIGCEVPTAPQGSRLIAPPAIFSEWWQEVERCSGLTGDFSRVDWYVVPCEPGETGFSCEVAADGLCAGEWRAPHVIELAGPNRVFPKGYVEDEWTVKHEMLHDLSGRSDHSRSFKDCHVALR